VHSIHVGKFTDGCMKTFKTDLHNHTVLSPCGDLDMSPAKIIEQAKKMNIEIMGITDHNNTLHCALCYEMGKEAGIHIIPGVEVNSVEEVHALALFENLDATAQFQHFLDAHLPFRANDTEKFGFQVVVDRSENIIGEEENLLIGALDVDLEEIAKQVQQLNGIFIPAHINRSANGIINQLGFIPPTLPYHALEITGNETRKNMVANNPYLKNTCFIASSDAHYVHQIGRFTTEIKMPHFNFQELKNAFQNFHQQISIA